MHPFCTSLLFFVALVHAKIQRVTFDAILYQESSPRSPSVLFSKTLRWQGQKSLSYKWKNVSEVVQRSGLKKRSLFCSFGKGGWVAYPHENFRIGTSLYVNIIVGEACVNAENVHSIQSLGPINRGIWTPHLGTSALFMFSSTYYTGDVLPPGKGTIFPIKSLIHCGKDSWTLEGYMKQGDIEISTGKRLCLRGTQKEMVFCGIPDLKALGHDSVDFVKVTRGCGNVTKALKQRCYGQGVHRVIVEDVPAPPSTCKSHLTLKEHRTILEYSVIVEIWKLRMTPEMEPVTIGKSVSGTHIHSTFSNQVQNVTSNLFRVLKTSCPEANSEYLLIFCHMFKIVVTEMFEWKGDYSEGKKFLNALAEFDVGLSQCPQRGSGKVDNNFNSPNCLDSQLKIKFPDLLPEILGQLGRICNTTVTFADTFQKFFTETKLDWDRIFEAGLHGFINVQEGSGIILRCLNGQ